jgi:glycosyltransferase involved in cell wall biosynthesis
LLKRVLITTDTVGGVWRYSIELAHGFAQRGASVTLVTLGPQPSREQRTETEAIPGLRLLCPDLPLDWLADDPAQLADAARALARMATRARIDSVHLHTPALVGTVSWPVPVVAVAHSCVGTWWAAVKGGAMPADLAWRAAAIAQGIAAADAVIAPTRSFAAALSAQYRCERPIQSVLNGRRPSPWRPRRKCGVFTAGRLWDAGKNVAAIDVAAGHLDFRLFAAGPTSSPSGDSIHYQHLHLLGKLGDAAMADRFAEAAVFVSMARYEPFGLAVLEAAQAGCALVLSDIPTFRELWDCAAVFVDADNSSRLAHVLGALARSPRRCAHLGHLARQRAASLAAERMVAATWRIHCALHQSPVVRVAA